MNLFRKALEKAKPVTNAKAPGDLAPVKRKAPGMMGAVAAALNARGNAKKQQTIRLAKRVPSR